MSTGTARLGAVTFLATAVAIGGGLLVHSAAAEPQRVSSRNLSRVVEGVPLSMEVPSAWERHDTFQVTRNTVGPQGAEALLFWAGFPGVRSPQACENLTGGRIGPSLAELAAAVAQAPGTQLVAGPTDVTVGGYPAKRMALTVRKDVGGCVPGFFYRWRTTMGGAFWLRTSVGDTIEVWIVKVRGKRLFIEAEMTRGGAYVHDEIRRMVASIRFG